LLHKNYETRKTSKHLTRHTACTHTTVTHTHKHTHIQANVLPADAAATLKLPAKQSEKPTEIDDKSTTSAAPAVEKPDVIVRNVEVSSEREKFNWDKTPSPSSTAVSGGEREVEEDEEEEKNSEE